MSPRISVVIPAYNSSRYLSSCLEHLGRSGFRDYECIVVDDCSTDGSAAVARQYGVTVLATDRRRGPAHARNLGAKAARGEILCFLDADVCVYPDTLERIWRNFAEDDQLAAVMGSYDDAPEARDFVSMYRNLMHCFVHHNSQRKACTFWSGCGAIRKSVFLDFSGFDESYDRPKIEDIELGYRLSAAQKKLALDKSILVKHLKPWSLLGLVRTDVLDRGIPWTELILRDRRLPNDLNLQTHYRLSVALVYLLTGLAAVGSWFMGLPFALAITTLVFLLLTPFAVQTSWRLQRNAVTAFLLLACAIAALAYRNHTLWLVPAVSTIFLLLLMRHRTELEGRNRPAMDMAAIAGLLSLAVFVPVSLSSSRLLICFYFILALIVWLNSRFYKFTAGRMGEINAVSVIPFHLLFFWYSGLSFGIGSFRYCWQRIPRDVARLWLRGTVSVK
jgi:GT2 family glycosyltransferase